MQEKSDVQLVTVLTAAAFYFKQHPGDLSYCPGLSRDLLTAGSSVLPGGCLPRWLPMELMFPQVSLEGRGVVGELGPMKRPKLGMGKEGGGLYPPMLESCRDSLMLHYSSCWTCSCERATRTPAVSDFIIWVQLFTSTRVHNFYYVPLLYELTWER